MDSTHVTDLEYATDLLNKHSCSLNHLTCFRVVGKENTVIQGGEMTKYIEHSLTLITQTYTLEEL